jgi:endonuclease V-like protein UPF0215 family
MEESLRIQIDKKGIRALGIAESFRISFGQKSVLGGVVARSDRVVDGFVFGSATIGAYDSTDAIIEMYEELNRNDINIVMLGGTIISFYNIIDVDEVASRTQTPVVAVTFKESKGLEDHIKHHFPDSYEDKMHAYQKLGERKKVKLKTGYEVFARTAGITLDEARKVLNKFTIQGSVPEPIRLAGALAKAKLDWDIKQST